MKNQATSPTSAQSDYDPSLSKIQFALKIARLCDELHSEYVVLDTVKAIRALAHMFDHLAQEDSDYWHTCNQEAREGIAAIHRALALRLENADPWKAMDNLDNAGE